jgi:hypothetical protein
VPSSQTFRSIPLAGHNDQVFRHLVLKEYRAGPRSGEFKDDPKVVIVKTVKGLCLQRDSADALKHFPLGPLKRQLSF